MQPNEENLGWAVEKVKLLMTAFGKKFENPGMIEAFAEQLLDIVEDNELIPAKDHPHSRASIGVPIRRGDWLIATLMREHRRWPVPFIWRTTWYQYWKPADGKSPNQMPGAEQS